MNSDYIELRARSAFGVFSEVNSHKWFLDGAYD